VTRGELKLRVARTLGVTLDNSDDGVEEAALLNELANEAVLDVLSRTRVNVRHANVALTGGIDEFDFDPYVLRVYGFLRGGREITEQPLGSLGSDGYVFVGYGRIKLGLAAAAGETAEIWYTPRPTPMTLDAHDPSNATYGGIPPEFHRSLLNYMLWQFADKAGDQGSQRGERYRAMYEGQDGLAGPGSDLGKIKVAVNTRGGSTLVRRTKQLLTGDRDASFWLG
jgi:hypothetical protein